MDLRLIVGLCLLGLQAGFTLPLLVQAFRSRSGDGIALATESLVLTSGLAWVSYALATKSLIVGISGGMAALSATVLIAVLWPSFSMAQKWTAATLNGGTLALLSLSWALLGVNGLAGALALVSLYQYAPQVILSATSLIRRSPANGVSLTSSLIRLAYGFFWGVYALAWQILGFSHDPIDWPLVAWALCVCTAYSLQAATGLKYRAIRTQDEFR